jgi:hypothetical protein
MAMTQPDIDRTFPSPHRFAIRSEAGGVLRPEFAFPRELKVVLFSVEFEPTEAEAWVGIFGDPYSQRMPSKVLTSPNADEVFVIAGGHGIRVDCRNPEAWHEVSAFPITDTVAAPEAGLILCADFTTVSAYGRYGLRWRTDRISTDGIQIIAVSGDVLTVRIWDGATNKSVVAAISTSSGGVLLETATSGLKPRPPEEG